MSGGVPRKDEAGDGEDQVPKVCGVEVCDVVFHDAQCNGGHIMYSSAMPTSGAVVASGVKMSAAPHAFNPQNAAGYLAQRTANHVATGAGVNYRLCFVWVFRGLRQGPKELPSSSLVFPAYSQHKRLELHTDCSSKDVIQNPKPEALNPKP